MSEHTVQTGLHIAIVGYGSSSLMLLKSLQDLPAELRQGWHVTVFERREGLGGQWLPDETVQDPRSSTALTGLYPELRTNTPVHMMTYPHFPFPNHTDLFPHWTVILKYLQDYAQTFGLYGSPDSAWDTCCQSYPEASVQSTRDPPQLKFSNTSPDAARKELPRRVLRNRELYSASWEGSTELGGRGRWKTISKPFPRKFDCTEEYQDEFDAIIDGTGHLVHPSIPHWQGEELWLAANEKRRIMHSAFYRGPAAFKDETVLIIGAGPSGLDGSLLIGRTAKKVYHSVTPTVILPPSWQYERKDRIAHFTADSIVFADGTKLTDVDKVYLGTGFIIRYEYLERGGILQRRPGQSLPDVKDETWPGIVSTDLYLRPLYEHTISVSPMHGPASLFWCGNIMSTSYRFSNAIQSALIAWTLALPLILPNEEEMLASIRDDEDRTRALGRSVEKTGHRQGPPHLGESETYQRRIVRFLQSKGIEVGCSERKEGVVMEDWREEVRKDFWQCMRGWMRLEKEGKAKDLLIHAVGEEGFAKVSRAVIAEQKIVESDRDPRESEVSGWH